MYKGETLKGEMFYNLYRISDQLGEFHVKMFPSSVSGFV